MTSTSDTLTLARDAHVAVLTLNRPESLNAINLEMRGALYETLDALRHNSQVRAVVLTGQGERAFCAGMDLREFSRLLAETPLTEMRR